MLGRQPELSLAELEAVFGAAKVRPIAPAAALVDTESLDIEKFGGIPKAGSVITTDAPSDWQRLKYDVADRFISLYGSTKNKLTLGLSVYGFNVAAKQVQEVLYPIKQQVKDRGGSIRLIPNQSPALNTAVSHHNKLGLSPNKIELLVVKAGDGRVIVARSTGAQNISSLSRRDQLRPKRDAFVGMLPPKLALQMINLAVGSRLVEGTSAEGRLLDPFCGTGVILQEAMLLGLPVYGTDISAKMIEYSRENLDWLARTRRLGSKRPPELAVADATRARWNQPICAVVSEIYLGMPMSTTPSESAVRRRQTESRELLAHFLANLSGQISRTTPICLAVPAVGTSDDSFKRLQLDDVLNTTGFVRRRFSLIGDTPLVYSRPGQKIAREMLVLQKR